MFIDNYIVKSLEIHLFFGRIMKEHSLFLKAGFTPANASFSNKAAFYKSEFEKLLSQAVALSGGVVGDDVLCSGEIVTEFTELAEMQSERFTGIPINKKITDRELRLCNGFGMRSVTPATRRQVRQLNMRALNLLEGLINFKKSILKKVTNCEMFTVNYPLMIEHIIREAELYREYIAILEESGNITGEKMRDIECFWNRIMMEHALFIRGLLDPSETELFDTADGFANDFSELLMRCQSAQDSTLTADSLEKTVKLRDFKAAGTEGIEQCKIRSIILPLLADHVLREANHYIRLLKNK